MISVEVIASITFCYPYQNLHAKKQLLICLEIRIIQLQLITLKSIFFWQSCCHLLIYLLYVKKVKEYFKLASKYVLYAVHKMEYASAILFMKGLSLNLWVLEKCIFGHNMNLVHENLQNNCTGRLELESSKFEVVVKRFDTS